MLADAQLIEFQDGEHLLEAVFRHARRGLGLATKEPAGGTLHDPLAATWVTQEPASSASLVPHRVSVLPALNDCPYPITPDNSGIDSGSERTDVPAALML